MSQQMVIIGAGLAGLSAAYTAARQGWQVWLCSSLPSERAQSVMAEGGINAALDTQGQDDSPDQHEADTLRAACG
ncbi:FAD-dependent oxidoreductase, partial [uncultured Megasphaera sp.]